MIKAIIRRSAIPPTTNTQTGTLITPTAFRIKFVIVKPPGKNTATKNQIGEINTHKNGSESDKNCEQKA